MRARAFVVFLAVLVGVLSFAGFAGSSAARAGQDVPTTTTEPPEVEVGGKQVERSPEKDPVEVDAMANTGASRVAVLAGLGLVLAGVGLVLVDLTHAPAVPAHRPLPRRSPPRSAWAAQRRPRRSR